MLEKLKKNLKPDSKLLKQPRKRPVWDGPESDTSNGGITFSLLSRFLTCRERFRCLVVEGLKPADTFNHRLEFGNMWHVCEEALALANDSKESLGETANRWTARLTVHARDLAQRYPFQREQIDHWYRVCLALFPLYVEHWSKHPDVTERTPLLQEQVFSVPYSLPSGRTVILRGKWDSVNLIGTGKEDGIFIQENKTKSQIDERKIVRQLRYDLQTLMYLIALKRWVELGETHLAKGTQLAPINGVRYNVVRRSAHKTPESMLKKVHEDAGNGRIGEWFARWKVEITPQDVETFKRECLDPILENSCWWWDVVNYTGNTPRKHEANLFHRYGIPPLTWRYPNGVWNPTLEGAESELDHYLENGSEAGLQRVENLFPELTEG